MIPSGVTVFVCASPVDMQWSFERLGGVIRERLGLEPSGGALFVFFGKRRETVKVMFADRTDMCMFYKRLSLGVFAQVETMSPSDNYLELDEAAFDDLLDGIQIEQAKRPRRRRRRTH